MRLSRIEIRNFRCFESLDIDLEPTTVLIGSNDTGKSTVLEAINILLDAEAYPYDFAWFKYQRQTGKGVRDHADASIVGVLTDLDDRALEWFGPSARDGRVTIGVSSQLGEPVSSRLSYALASRWIVLEDDDVPGFIDELDGVRLREWLEIGPSDDMLPKLKELRMFADMDGRTWVDPGIWEWGSMQIWDVLEAGGDVFRTITLGGPSDTAWSPKAVVEPIIRRQIRRATTAARRKERQSSGDAEATTDGPAPTEGSLASEQVASGLAALDEAIKSLLKQVSDAHTSALGPSDSFKRVVWGAQLLPDGLADAVVERLIAAVPAEAGTGRKGTSIDDLGPGSQRSLALRALSLYRDPDLWPPETDDFDIPSLAVLLVEEPESGLHPAAQRAVADAFRSWATYGIQLVMVTHSPVFVNAVEPSGLRLARKLAVADEAVERTVIVPTGLEEIREAVGARPSDVLLARRFVVVEGASDQIVFDFWARTFGVDLRSEGVQLVPADSSSKVEQVAGFLDLAYEGADFLVVLDNGRDTAKIKLELDERFGARVETILLGRTEIEAYYHPDAVVRWLQAKGVEDKELSDRARKAVEAKGGVAKALGRLKQHYLGEDFDKVEDGRSIAHFTTNEMLSPEIVGLLNRFVAP